ncbi:hypothetical protein KM043_018493 [Ampulex compressa]|nr:hypothetical protein KM043_018493 [Ampulex compressa]
MLIQFLWFCIHLALLLPYTDTKILQGQLITRDDWAFLARFCFSTEEGTFQYQFILGGQEENLKLLLYYDSPHQWPSVYATNKTCEEKVLILSNGKNQVLSITLLLDEWPIPVFHSILEPVRLFQSVVKDRIIVMKYAHEQQPLYLPFHICLHLSRNHSIKRLLRSNSI